MKGKNLLLIVNPKSGRAKMKTELLSVVEIFSNNGYFVTVYPTKCQGDATVKISTLKQDEFDIIVVCGGDGTLNEVITGLMNSSIKCDLGYIPSGTLNEWSSGLNISRNVKQAAEDILTGKTISLDIGKFDERYFSYTASFGAFTEASYSAPQEIKNVLGQAAYFFEGIKSLANIKPIHLKLEVDGEKLEDDYLFGAVSNSMSVGGIVKFSDATVKLNDGKFEVLLIKKPANLTVLQSIIDGILRRDLTRDGIEFLHAEKIKIFSSVPVSWTLDGEFAEGKGETVIENIHSSIDFIVPNKATQLNNIKE